MKGKNKGGYPKFVLDEKQVEKVRELSGKYTIVQIAQYFGMSETTFLQVKKRQPEVAIAYKDGKNKCTELVISKLWEHITEGNLSAIVFWLKVKEGWSTDKNKQSNVKLKMTKDPIALIDSTLEAIGKGELTIQEAVQIASIATTRANLVANLGTEELTANKAIDSLALDEKVKAYAKVIEHIKSNN